MTKRIENKSFSFISSLKRPDDNSLTNDPLEISNIFNNYFSSVGKNLASRVPRSSRYFAEYLSPSYNPSSFFFDPVTPEEIERRGVARIFQRGGHRGYSPDHHPGITDYIWFISLLSPRVPAGSVVLSGHEGPY